MSSTATLVPNADDTFTGASKTLVGAATSWQCLLSADGDTTYVQFGTAGTVSCAMGDMPAALAVASVVVNCQYKFTGAPSDQQTRMWLDIGGVKYYSSLVNSQSSAYANLSNTWTTNPATSAAWTPAAVNSAKAGIEYSTATSESIRYTYLWIDVTYTPLPPTVDVTRHVGSVSLWLKKRPEAFLQFDGNLDLLNLNLLDMADVEHTAGPHATDLGWEDEVWQRRPFSVHSMSIDLNSMTVSAKLKDQRPIRCLLRDLAWSDKASGSLGDGIARFATPGATWSFTRASEHTFTNPVGESETVPVDTAAYGSGGLYMLSSSGGRAAPRYYVTNNSGKRTLNAAQGSFVCEVNLAAVSGAANQAVAYCYHDASNWWYLYWDGPNARWVFEVRQAGSTYRATKSATPSSATWYQIGARWTGSNGELGASPYTLSVWVDRVKGTDAVAGGAMTEAASSNFDFGSKAAAGTEQLNGQIRKIHSFQEVMNDTEMARQI